MNLFAKLKSYKRVKEYCTSNIATTIVEAAINCKLLNGAFVPYRRVH